MFSHTEVVQGLLSLACCFTGPAKESVVLQQIGFALTTIFFSLLVLTVFVSSGR